MEIPARYFEMELKEKLELLRSNIKYTHNKPNHPFLYSTSKKYQYHTEVWIPKNPINLANLTDPSVIEKRTKNRGKSLHREKNIENSVRRTRQTIFGYSAMNPFTDWVTFTQDCSRCAWKCSQKLCSIKTPHKKVDCNTTKCDCPPMFCDRYNLETLERRVTNWLKNNKVRTSPDLEFLLVYEKHKCAECNRSKEDKCEHSDRPRAYHAHAFMMGYNGKKERGIDHFSRKKALYHKRPVFNYTGWQFGFTKVVPIGQSKEDSVKVSAYLTKYITKETITDLNKHRYKASRGLIKPFRGRNDDFIDSGMIPALDGAYESDYGVKLQVDNRKIAKMICEECMCMWSPTLIGVTPGECPACYSHQVTPLEPEE